MNPSTQQTRRNHQRPGTTRSVRRRTGLGLRADVLGCAMLLGGVALFANPSATGQDQPPVRTTVRIVVQDADERDRLRELARLQDADDDADDLERRRELQVLIAEMGRREMSATRSDLVEVIPDDDTLRTLPPDDAFIEALDDLDADDFAARQRATFELITSRIDQVQFYAALARGGLSAEQRHRLLKIIEERLLHQPRGALGIQMSEIGNEGIVQVTSLVPGLPAERVLQVNDIITEIDGVTPDSGEMVNHIQAHRPGDTVTLTVERTVQNGNGERETQTLTIDVELGSTELLNGGRDNRNVPGIRRSTYDPRSIEYNEVLRRWGSLRDRAMITLWPRVLSRATQAGD